MSLNKRFKKPSGKKKLRFEIDGYIADELALYLKYAHEDGCDWLTADTIAETFFKESLNRDREFRSWLSKHRKGSKSSPSSPASASEQ